MPPQVRQRGGEVVARHQGVARVGAQAPFGLAGDGLLLGQRVGAAAHLTPLQGARVAHHQRGGFGRAPELGAQGQALIQPAQLGLVVQAYPAVANQQVEQVVARQVFAHGVGRVLGHRLQCGGQRNGRRAGLALALLLARLLDGGHHRRIRRAQRRQGLRPCRAHAHARQPARASQCAPDAFPYHCHTFQRLWLPTICPGREYGEYRPHEMRIWKV